MPCDISVIMWFEDDSPSKHACETDKASNSFVLTAAQQFACLSSGKHALFTENLPIFE